MTADSPQAQAEKIVRALAAADEPLDGDVSESCTLCSYVYYIGIHDEDCPWRMARAWVADNPRYVKPTR